MNSFEVPKKVNRHVLKALNTLCDGKIRKRIPTALIIDQVKQQMRDLVPVPHIERVIENSLRNLSDHGLIQSSGPNGFSIGRSYAPTGKPNKSDKTTNRQKRPIGRAVDDDVDPNLNGMPSSSKQLRYSERDMMLPKARGQRSQLREFDFVNTWYASDGSYLSDSTVGTDWRRESDWDEDAQLLPVGNFNADFALPLEITEIPSEGARLNIVQQTEEITHDDAGSGDKQTEDNLTSEQSKSHEALKVSSQISGSSPNTTGEGADEDDAEQQANDSEEYTSADKDKLRALWL